MEYVNISILPYFLWTIFVKIAIGLCFEPGPALKPIFSQACVELLSCNGIFAGTQLHATKWVWFIFEAALYPVVYFYPIFHCTLVTQPMMQRQPNQTEARRMDSYSQILCRFQKNKKKMK